MPFAINNHNQYLHHQSRVPITRIYNPAFRYIKHGYIKTWNLIPMRSMLTRTLSRCITLSSKDDNSRYTELMGILCSLLMTLYVSYLKWIRSEITDSSKIIRQIRDISREDKLPHHHLNSKNDSKRAIRTISTSLLRRVYINA
jgi:hypothetical protein